MTKHDKPCKPKPHRVLTIRISEELHQAIVDETHKQRISQTELLREMIREWLGVEGAL